MKEVKYDKELMDQYIEQKWYDATCEPITEEDRQIIAESLDFNAFCLNIRWNEFKKAVSQMPIIRRIAKFKKESE